CRQYNNLPLTF
nr:immunoglobulin light chain junction region [Macaca mulatta]